MSELDYKHWLIEEAARITKEELEEYGITTSTFISYEDCIYSKAFSTFCDNCPNQSEKCDNCDYNICVEEYISQGNDYLNTGLIKE